jgi:outer membrane protein TolC
VTRSLFLIGAMLAAPSGSAAAGDVPAQSDPVLEGLLARAMASSPLLDRARAAADGAQAKAGLARSAYWPILGASEQVTRTNEPPAAFALLLDQGRFSPAAFASINDPPPVGDWATTLYARYLLTDFGRRGAGMQGAREDEERVRLLAQAAERDVRYAVAEAYYGLGRARAAVALWDETVRLTRAHEDLTRARHEAGAVLKSDLLSIGVRLAEARESGISARGDVQVAGAKLAAAVGAPGEPLDVPEVSLGIPRYDAGEEAVVRAALDGHPALLALDAEARAQEQAERAAARGTWPTLSGEIRGVWHGDDETPGLERDFYLAAVVLDVPFFDGGRSRSARREAAARRREIDAARRAAAGDLDVAARAAHHRAGDAVARVAIAGEAIAAAEEALRIIEERYRSGLAKVVDLIEAERALAGARVRALDARAVAWTSIAAVARVAGEEVLR